MGHKGGAIRFTKSTGKKLHRGSGSWRQSLGLKAEGKGHSKHRCVCTDMLYLKHYKSSRCLQGRVSRKKHSAGPYSSQPPSSHFQHLAMSVCILGCHTWEECYWNLGLKLWMLPNIPWPRIIQSTKSMLFLVNFVEHKRTREVRWKVSHNPAPNLPHLK